MPVFNLSQIVYIVYFDTPISFATISMAPFISKIPLRASPAIIMRFSRSLKHLGLRELRHAFVQGGVDEVANLRVKMLDDVLFPARSGAKSNRKSERERRCPD